MVLKKDELDAEAATIAEAIKKFTRESTRVTFTAADIAKTMGVTADKVSQFLYERKNITLATKHAALKEKINFQVVVEGGRGTPAVFGLPPPKQPLPDTKMVKIEYKKKAEKVDKTPEELLSEIKNEMVVLTREINDLYAVQRKLLEVQENTYNLFRELSEKGRK